MSTVPTPEPARLRTEQGVAELLTELGVLRRGHFVLSSGAHSPVYLQCALALQHPRVALALGAALVDRLGDVDVVASPALGGLLAGFAVAAAAPARFVFAERGSDGVFALRRAQRVEPGQRVVVVEDVVTTGGSAQEVVTLLERDGADVTQVACIVDRSIGLPPTQRPPFTPVSLLRVDAPALDERDCPMCDQGSVALRPGSRGSG